MNRFVGLALSLAINSALLGALQWSSVAAQRAPEGEVYITELPAPPYGLYARASSGELG